ncbi:PaaI family thioesterase [Variovorax humicola]|uniref:PaaI family thioesterase n=1 Tax=Variovorax humicola TaxID=1769758 RepID=A0ABU8W7H1_9BURK
MDIQKLPSALLRAIGFTELLRTDAEVGAARARFTARPEFAHTNGTVVQGGIITTWLDFSMALAVMSREPDAALASLELKVTFLERVDVSTFDVEARVLRWGRSVVFLEADLFAQDGRLCARASSTGKLVRAKG